MPGQKTPPPLFDIREGKENIIKIKKLSEYKRLEIIRV